MARRIRRKEEELRRRRAQRASEFAYASRSVGLTDLHAPRPPELARQTVARREEQTRRAYASQGHAFGLTVGLGNGAAAGAARAAMPGDHGARDVDVHRSRRMAADLVSRSSEPVWQEDGRYSMRDEAAGLDVVYDPAGGAPDVDLKQVEQGLGGGAPLDTETRQYMEWRFGVSFERVRIHNSSKAGAISKALYAHAFALGKDVAFAQGTYRPGTKSGDRLLAHELTHVVQAGLAPKDGEVHKSASVSEPTDHFEVEADRMADQVVSVSRAEFQRARREGTLGKDPEETARKRAAAAEVMASRSAEPSLSRSTTAPSSGTRGPSSGTRGPSSEGVSRSEAQRSGGESGGGDAKKDIQFTLKLLEDVQIEIKGSKAKKPTYTRQVSFPGLRSAKVVLNLADGKVTGGVLTGQAHPKELKGPVEFQVGTDGKVSGDSEVHWHCRGFGEGEITVKPLMGCLAGSAEVTAEQVESGKDLSVGEFTGTVRVYGADNSVTAQGSGRGSVSEGALDGDLTLDYKTEGGATGTLKADIKIEGFKKAFENGQVAGVGLDELPKFDLDLKDGAWSGDQVVPYNKGAPGLSGQSDVHLSYKGGKFSGAGDGTFEIAEFLRGTVSNTVTADGSVNGTFKIGTDAFSFGPISCEKISLHGGIKDDVVDVQASGSLSAFDGKVKGTFHSNLAETGGLKWDGTVSLDIPQMKKTEVKLTYEVGKGVKGEGSVVPKLDILTGEAKLKFDGTKFSGEADFDVHLPLLTGAKVKAKYEDGKFTGSTAIEAGAVQIPNIQITSSSLQATFGDDFSIAGSCAASMAGGLVSGSLEMSYKAGKFDAGLHSSFSIPGINPVDLDLAYKSGKLSGSASTTLSLPLADEAGLTIYYRDGAFGGKGRVGFNIPGLNKVQGEVEITPEGQLNGSLAIKPKDFKIPPLTVESCDITGKITNGKLSVEGGGSVKGIPLTESATLRATFSEADGFGGSIETKLKIPGLKEAAVKLKLKGGEVSGSVKAEAEMVGFTGGVEIGYDAGKWSGEGKLSYKKGKFDGSITAKVAETGQLSGKGSVSYKISDNFQVTAELELREDQSMVIGGKIECPNKVELFKKEYEKNLFKMRGRFGIPGLSIQVPVVGVIGLEAQLSGSLDLKAGVDLFLTDLTAGGTFDTATGLVDLDLGGTVKGRAYAGIEASARLAVGLGVGPAFIGGYVQITGSAMVEAEVSASVNAHYTGGGPLKLHFGVGASAGLVLALTISGGITASVDLWVKTLKKDWEIASKTWEFRPGGKLEYKKDFDYELGSAPSAAMLAPDSIPSIDGNDMARQAGGQASL